MAYLNEQQIERLLAAIAPSRVVKLDGLSHLEAYDVRAHLNRVFGFGRWSADVIEMTLINERFGKNSKGRDAVYVVYRAGLRLTVNAPDGTQLATYTEYAAGDALGFPVAKLGDAHDFAMKTAESQALKRAATNLGDQFGLSLYNSGSTKQIVQVSLVGVAEADPDFKTPEVTPEQAPAEGRDWQAELDAVADRDALNALWHEVRQGVPGEQLEQWKVAFSSRANELQAAA